MQFRVSGLPWPEPCLRSGFSCLGAGPLRRAADPIRRSDYPPGFCPGFASRFLPATLGSRPASSLRLYREVKAEDCHREDHQGRDEPNVQHKFLINTISIAQQRDPRPLGARGSVGPSERQSVRA